MHVNNNHVSRWLGLPAVISDPGRSFTSVDDASAVVVLVAVVLLALPGVLSLVVDLSLREPPV